MRTTPAEIRIGIIVSAREQIPFAQAFARAFCENLHLGERYSYKLQLIIEEFLMSLFEQTGFSGAIPFYLERMEKAIRMIFDITGTGFKPVLGDFSIDEIQADKEVESLIGMTVLKRIVDSIKGVKEGEREEIHFILYLGEDVFKDSFGLPKRYPSLRNNVLVSEVRKQGEIRYNLRLQDGGDFFSVNEKSYFIIQMLDGKHEILNIVRSFSDRFDPISPEAVHHFIDTLQEKGFLEPELDIAFGREYIEKQTALSWLEKILSFEYSLPHVDRIVSFVYGKSRWIFSKGALFLILLSLGACVWEVIQGNASLHMGFVFTDRMNDPWIIIIYYPIMFLTVITHEFAHALSCKHYGGEVNKMGIMIYYFQVCAFADTSDAWLFKERYKRILTALNGPLWSLFLASACLWVYYLVTPVGVNSQGTIHGWLSYLGHHVLGIGDLLTAKVEQIAIMVMAANILTTFFNLIPLAETDGYYILSDLTNRHNIRNLSMGYVLNVFRRLLGKYPYPIHPSTIAAKVGYAVYGSLCFLYFIGALLGVLFFFTFKYDIAIHSVFGVFAVVNLSLFGLKALLLKRIQRKREFLRRKVRSY